MATNENDGVKKKDDDAAGGLAMAALALANKNPKEEPKELPRDKLNLYTEDSWKQQVDSQIAAKRKFEKTGGVAEAHLVDGELKFDDDEEEAKKDRDPALVEGNILPIDYEDAYKPEFAGKPLEEIDRYIKDKTFIAIASRFKKKFIYRFSAEKGLFLLTPWNPLRKFAVFVATNQFFDYVVILTILANCVFMSLGPDSKAAETAEYAFLAIYTIEAIIKILARGFILNKFTYLRDPWNWLDFTVIVSAYVTMIISEVSNTGGTNLQALRTFRVFRALKTISIIPGLKTLVGALLRAFKLLFEVIILITFCLAVFALFGLQVYMGVLRQKCVANVPSYTASSSWSYLAYYNDWIKNTSNWYEDPENLGTYVICGNASGSGKCGDGYTCLPDIGENPNFGYTSFDHFGWAMLTSFQLITLDFWEDSYNKIIRASGPWNVLFFVLVVFFGSFYLINLMLAVVAMSYEEEAVSAGKRWRFGTGRFMEKADNEKKEKERERQKIKELTTATKAAQKWNPGHRKNKTGVIGKDAKELTSGKNDKNDRNDKKSDTTNGQPLIKYGKGRNPMVKMPSKDSGYSVESKTSSNGKDTPREDGDDFSLDSDSNPRKADSGTGSLSQEPVYDKKTPRGKKENVSAADVQLWKNDEKLSNMSREETVVIIKPDEDGVITIKEKNELVDRNCECCSKTSMFVCWLKFQNYLNMFVSDPLFDLFVTLCIVLNTLFMMLEHHDQPDDLTTTLTVSNYIFTGVFILEAVLKILSWSKFYFKSGWNLFDFFIVIASIIDLMGQDIPSLSLFRAFRLLRVLKLAQSWKTMRILLQIILSTLGSLGPLTLILVIVIYIFAVIGLQLFSKSYTAAVFGDDMPRWHFEDFFHSMMMVFRVLCGEWIEPLWDCMRAEGELCMVVFLPTLVLGNFIVLNLFLALLINAFASDNLKSAGDSDDTNKMMLAFHRIKELFCCCLSKKGGTVRPDEVDEGMELSDIESINADDKTDKNASKDKKDGKDPKKGDDKFKLPPIQSNGMVQTKEGDKKDGKGKDKEKDKEKGKDKDIDEAFKTKRDTFASFDTAKQANSKKDDKNKDSKSDNDDDLELGEEASTHSDKSKDDEKKEVVVQTCLPLCLSTRMEKRCCTRGWDHFDQTAFGLKWYKFRRAMTIIVESKLFEGTVLICIALSSITLAFEDIYLYQKPGLEQALYIINIIFVVLFTIEMLIKWFALGLKAYFTSFWTILDFMIVVISWASFGAEAAGAADISAFRSLRTLRALRPLRAISRWQGMKIVVNALMLSIPSIINVILVCLIFWLIFSIMGVQFFAGKFYKCVDNDGEKFEPTVIANRSQCVSEGYNWTNSKINFDHVGQGFLALFQVATFEGWMELMEDAVDATDVDKQPSYESNKWYYLFFVGFIVFGSFFTLNLIISVIIDNFNELKKQYEGHVLDMFLTTTQRNYMNTLKKLGNKKPQKTIKRPKNFLQGVFYDVSVSTKFDLCIVVVIFMNMIVMGIEHYKQSEMVTDILQIMNIIFTTIFTLEAAIKITGLRFHYFRQPWNVFDFVVVVLSILAIILEDILESLSVSPTLLRVVRVFRIGRVLRLIKAAKGIRKLLFALIISLPALINIGALLCLIMFIYAIIGMSSFGNLKIAGGVLDEDVVNFKTFASSFVLLLRLSTSAGWNDVLEPLLQQPPDCNDKYITRPDGSLYEQENGDCGTPWLAYFFMCSYILIIFLIIINTYIAVILENFNQAHQQEEVGITEDDFDMFYVVWEKYDPLATQFLKYDHLTSFVADLDEPLGIPKPNEIALVAFDLPIVEGDKIHCLDILMSLVKHVLGRVEETEEFKQLKTELELKFSETFPTRVKTNKTSSTMMKKKEDVAAKTLQRAWKSFKTQKSLRNITQLAKLQKHQEEEAALAAQKGNSITNLGRRLSSALSQFFSSSRPTSAVSRTSTKSTTTLTKPTKKKNTLNVPSVGSIYPAKQHQSDIDL